MSAFMKYLIGKYGFEYIKNIYTAMETGGFDISIIEREIPDEIPDIYDNFIEDYVLGKIHKDLTVQLLRSYKSQNITLNNSSTKTISINETYKNLSSKIYTFNIDKTTLKTTNSIKITTQNPNVQLIMIKYKKNTTTGEWERIKASEGKGSVELKNIKQIYDDGYDLLLIATLCDPDDKTYYSKTKSVQKKLAEEHNISFNFEIAEVEENILCQLKWRITAEYDVTSSASRETFQQFKGNFERLNILLTNAGGNTYTSTFESKNPFGGANYEKGQFTITVTENSHADFTLVVTDTYYNICGVKKNGH